jgi:hypothetical protein
MLIEFDESSIDTIESFARMWQKRYRNPNDLARVITRERVISPGVSGAGVSRLDQIPKVNVAYEFDSFLIANSLFASSLPKLTYKENVNVVLDRWRQFRDAGAPHYGLQTNTGQL